MQETDINQQVTETNQQFIQLFSSFSDSQINQVPFMESWTPAQLAEHILKSESGMLQALQSPGKKADRDPFANVQRLKDTFLDFSIKMRSPEFIVPENKEYNKEELEQKLTGIAFQLAETINHVNIEEIISGLLNQVPFMESWTPAQLAEHILKSESGMLQALQSPGKKADRDPFANVQRLKDTFLDFSIKMRSPEFIVPENKEYNKEELEQKLTGIAFQLAETINHVNIEEIISGLPLGEISKGEIIHFIVYHTKRHIHQLQHILQTLNDKTKAMSATKEVIVRNVNNAFKNNDVAAFLSYCTDDIIWNMVGSSATQGKDAIMKMMSSMTSDCPGIRIHTVFSEDDKTACAGTFTLVNKEGKKTVHSFCDIYKFRDEKIQILDSYVVETKP